MNTILKAVIEIGIDVAIINRGKRIAARQQLLDLPAAGFAAASFFIGKIIRDSELFVISHPRTRHRDSRIRMDRLVSTKVQSEESRERPRGGIRQIDKD